MICVWLPRPQTQALWHLLSSRQPPHEPANKTVR